jgi:hypothetical protein
MVLTSSNYPSAFPQPGGLPHPGKQPYPEAVLVRLTSAMNTEQPFAIVGDQHQWLWLSPGAAAFAVGGKNAVYYEPAQPSS